MINNNLSSSNGRAIATGITLLLVVVVAVGTCEAFGWPFLREPLRKQMSMMLNRPVVLSDAFRIRFFGSIRVDSNLVIIRDLAKDRRESTEEKSIDYKEVAKGAGIPAEVSPDLFKAKNLHVALSYGDVFSFIRSPGTSGIDIEAFEVETLNAYLVRDNDGNANWNIKEKTTKDTPSAPVRIPNFDKLLIEEGKIILDDKLEKIRVAVDISTHEGGQSAGRKGMRVNAKGSYKDRSFAMRLTSSGILPLIAPPNAAMPVPINVTLTSSSATLKFDGTVIDLLILKGLDGQLSVAGPSLATVGDLVGITLPATTNFSLGGQLKRTDDVWSLEKARLDVGESHLRGNFTFDRHPKVPLLSGELNGNPLVLADLAPAFGAPAQEEAGTEVTTGQVLPQREFDIPSLRAMNANIKLRLQKVSLGRLFARPLQPLEGDLKMHDGVLSISHLLARTADGQLSGSFSIDSNASPALWKTDLSWADILIEKWFVSNKELTSNAEASSEAKMTNYVTGTLHGNAKFEGAGNSTASMLGSLNGITRTWIKDGKISNLTVELMGLDVAQGLGVFISGDQLLSMRCAIFSLNAHHGQLTPDVAIIDTADTTILLTGALSLASEEMNLRLVAQPKDVSPLTLRVPLKLEGKLSDPSIRPESKPLGRKILRSVVLGLIQPLAAIIPMIDMGEDNIKYNCKNALDELNLYKE